MTDQTAAAAVFAEIKDGVQADHPHSAVVPMAAVAICQALGIDPDGPADPIAEAVAEERRACAGAVDEMCDDVDDPFMYGTLRAVAAAIRNRGEATDV